MSSPPVVEDGAPLAADATDTASQRTAVSHEEDEARAVDRAALPTMLPLLALALPPQLALPPLGARRPIAPMLEVR